MTPWVSEEEEAAYRRRAEAGDPAAMGALGHQLQSRGAKEEAVRWWRAGASAGDAYSMGQLARALWDRNREEAQQWSWLAAAAARDPRTDAVPAEVMAAAAAAELGAHKSSFGTEEPTPTTRWTTPRSRTIGAVLAIVPVVILIANGGRPGGFAIAFMVIFALVAVAAFFSPGTSQASANAMRRMSNIPKVWVFERGFLHSDRKTGQLEVFPWTQSRVTKANTRRLRNGSYEGTTFRYTLLRGDGTRIVLEGDSYSSGDVWVLGELIGREITSVRLARALAALNEGQRVDFGNLSLDCAGIYDGKDLLPWRDVERVDAREGRVRIKRVGGLLNWSKTSVSDIPDVDVLFILANDLSRAAKTGN